MARDISIKDSINAEKRLFTDRQFSDIQEALARGGRVKAEDIPLSLREALDLNDGQKIRLTGKGLENFITDRNNEIEGRENYASNQDFIRISLLAADNLSNRRGFGRNRVLTPEQEQVEAQRVSDVRASVPQLAGARTSAVGVNPSSSVVTASGTPVGTVVENPGELDYGGIKGLVNQLNNLLRPLARKAANTTPMGAVGENLIESGVGKNPLKELLSNTTKKIKKMGAEIGSNGQPITLEDQLLQYLEENKNNPSRAFSQATPRFDPFGRQPRNQRGLSRFVGDVATINEHGQKIYHSINGKRYTIDAAGQVIQL